jgi:hypothetical protein
MTEFCPKKGVHHALDHIFDSPHFVAVGIYWWLYDGWIHPYPAGHCRHRISGPTYSGTKNIVTLAGEGEVFRKEVAGRPRILRMARYLQ